jgi:hypothetical protein
MTRTQRLEKALEWAIQGNKIVDYGSGIEGRSRGCGCCSYDEEIPEDLRSELVAAYRRLHPETSGEPCA